MAPQQFQQILLFYNPNICYQVHLQEIIINLQVILNLLQLIMSQQITNQDQNHNQSQTDSNPKQPTQHPSEDIKKDNQQSPKHHLIHHDQPSLQQKQIIYPQKDASQPSQKALSEKSIKSSQDKDTSQQLNSQTQNLQAAQVQTQQIKQKEKEDSDSEDDDKKNNRVPREKKIQKEKGMSDHEKKRIQQAQIHHQNQKDPVYYKTKMCPMFKSGNCYRDNKCNFAHSQEQLRELPNYKKTRMCVPFTQGRCPLDKRECKYAHGEEDMKQLSYTYGVIYTRDRTRDRDYHHKQYRQQRSSRDYHRDHREDHREDQRRDHRNRDHRHRDERDYRGSYQRDRHQRSSGYGDSYDNYEPQKYKYQSSRFNEEVMRKYSINPMPQIYPNPIGTINSYPSNPYTSSAPASNYSNIPNADYRYPPTNSSNINWSSYPPNSSVPGSVTTTIPPNYYGGRWYETNPNSDNGGSSASYYNSHGGTFSKPFSS